jgi:hypothetical protein
VPADKTRLTRIGLGVLILVLLVTLALILLSLLNVVGTPTTAAPTGKTQIWRAADSGLTLEASAQQAEARAQTWAADAVLIRAEAAWRPGTEGRQLDMPPVTWSFYYYSPAMRALATVVVGRDQLFWVPPLEISYAPKSVPALPQYGIEVAWLSFRAAGGEDFLSKHPEAMVDFRLRPHTNGVVWSVAAFEGKDYLEVLIDAESGAVLPSSK